MIEKCFLILRNLFNCLEPAWRSLSNKLLRKFDRGKNGRRSSFKSNMCFRTRAATTKIWPTAYNLRFYLNKTIINISFWKVHTDKTNFRDRQTMTNNVVHCFFYNLRVYHLHCCYPPVAQQSQTLTYWTIRTLFIAMTTSCLEESAPTEEFTVIQFSREFLRILVDWIRCLFEATKQR